MRRRVRPGPGPSPSPGIGIGSISRWDEGGGDGGGRRAIRTVGGFGLAAAALPVKGWAKIRAKAGASDGRMHGIELQAGGERSGEAAGLGGRREAGKRRKRRVAPPRRRRRWRLAGQRSVSDRRQPVDVGPPVFGGTNSGIARARHSRG